MIESFAIVFNYYILTRDKNKEYSFDEIRKKYVEIIEKKDSLKKYKENIIDNGYITHSFNGNEKNFIEKYGFEYRDYTYNLGHLVNSGKISAEDAYKIKRRENLMKKMEEVTNTHNEYYTRPYEVFFCMPGESTFEYAFKYSPEKIFNGPLKDIDEPIIIGETKQNFMTRVLEKRISDKELSAEIAKEFCSKPSCIAMIKIKELYNKSVYYASTLNEEISLKNELENEELNSIEDLLKSGYARRIHKSKHIFKGVRLLDMAVKKDSVSKDKISIVRIPDLFYLKQLYAKAQGVLEGEKIDYNTCERIQVETDVENKKYIGNSWNEDR